MRLKYSEISSYYQALEKIGGYHLPILATNAIIRNKRALRPAVSDFETQKQGIIERYAKKDENGQFIIDTESDPPRYTFGSNEEIISFARELEVLKSIEEEVHVVKFPYSEFEKCETDNRFDIPTPEEIEGIGWMIDYGEEE